MKKYVTDDLNTDAILHRPAKYNDDSDEPGSCPKFKAGDAVCFKGHPDICIGYISQDSFLCFDGSYSIFTSGDYIKHFTNGTATNTLTGIHEHDIQLFEKTYKYTDGVSVWTDEFKNYVINNDDDKIKKVIEFCELWLRTHDTPEYIKNTNSPELIPYVSYKMFSDMAAAARNEFLK